MRVRGTLKPTFEVYDIDAFNNFRYNLCLIAPGKGEAKKTVSNGLIRLSTRRQDGDLRDTMILDGVATDDILSAAGSVKVTRMEGLSQPVYTTVEALKALEGSPVVDSNNLRFSLCDTEDFDQNFDQLFWKEHTLDSIDGEHDGFQPTIAVKISPDRLRKFSLLKPQGNPIEWVFVEWADRNIIRWTYLDWKGVYVPLD